MSDLDFANLLATATGDEPTSTTPSTVNSNMDSIAELPQFSEFRVLHVDPLVLAVDDFFTDEECDRYVKLSDNKDEDAPAFETRSKTVGKDRLAKSQRTSTTWFHHYRSVPELAENYAVSAVFAGETSPVEDIETKIGASMDKRKSSQPVAASAGCIFKNPEEVPAGKLVEELGLKDASVGEARVSDVHGNFIVNQGGASAADVIGLIEQIKERARSERGIELETEVQIIGQAEPAF